MKIERFEDIEAWQLARQLTHTIYALTHKPDFAKDHGLKSQIRNAAGSSMHNIAEGFDSETNIEFIRFLRYAKRSCTEVQSELHMAHDQKYITSQDFNAAYEQARITRATIRAFINYLRKYEEARSPSRNPLPLPTLNREP